MFRPHESIGPYTLIRQLGEGQFGVVWLARREKQGTQQEVALKVLKHPDANAILQEVLNWARASDHSNILPIIDARHLDTRVGTLPVIISGYVSEGSLRGWLARRRPVSAETAVEVACGILDGLSHLHGKDIIHRDLKPENVLMEQGRPLLTDFGLARRHAGDGDVLTGGIQGTIEYMAPESFGSVRAPQVDVWAAAVICYEMLAGHRPFPRDPQAICSKPPLPLPDSVPGALRQVLKLALKQDEALRRYKGAAELRNALLEAVAGRAETRTTLAAVPDIPTLAAAPDAAREVGPCENPPPASDARPQNIFNLRARDFKTRTLLFESSASEQASPAGGQRGDSITNVEFDSIEVREDTKINH